MDMVLGQGAIEVLNPTADDYGSARSPLAPRLKSLEGKTVGLLWNGKMGADVALKTFGEMLKERVPSVEIRFYQGTIRFARELLAQAIEECDAAVTCAADCGACTSWLIHDSIQLERAGVATVTIASKGFEKDAQATAAAFDMPGIRYVVVPRVYNALTAEQAADQTRPAYDDMVRALTDEDAVAEGVLGAPEGEVVNFSGEDGLEAYRQFNAFYLAKDWGDGFPLVPPTRASVEALLAGVKADRKDLVCLLPPGMGHATVEKVAINAAMAGCTAQEIPVIMAALRAISKCPKPFDKSALMSTGAFAPMILVNGPIARELRVNGGRCCLGPGKDNEANLRIGRAVNLCLRNIGRWIPGVMDLDTLGTSRKISLCLAENEAESPWEPYQVNHGYRPEDNTVTVFHTTGEWDTPIAGVGDHSLELLRNLGARMPWSPQGGRVVEVLAHSTGKEDHRVLLLNPDHAHAIAADGFSKQQAAEIIHQHHRVNIWDLVQSLRTRDKRGQTRPQWKWLFELSPAEQRAQTITATTEPECIHVVVAGSHTPKPMVFGVITPPVIEPVTDAAGG